MFLILLYCAVCWSYGLRLLRRENGELNQYSVHDLNGWKYQIFVWIIAPIWAPFVLLHEFEVSDKIVKVINSILNIKNKEV